MSKAFIRTPDYAALTSNLLRDSYQVPLPSACNIIRASSHTVPIMIDYVAPQGRYRADVNLNRAYSLSSSLALPSSLPAKYEARFRDECGAMHDPHHTA